MKYKKILVPFDNSEFSNKALEHAVEIARMAKTTYKTDDVKLILLHVLEEMPRMHEIGEIPIDTRNGDKIRANQFVRELHQHKVEDMENLFQKIKDNFKSANMDIISVILTGNTADKIVEYIENENIDLVVIGSQGLRGFKMIKSLGSVSRKVSEKIHCPIMIIH